MIELFIFDMGGVLCRDFDVGPEAAARVGLPVDKWRRLVSPDLQAFMRGEFGSREFWKRFEARCGVRVPGDPWADCFSPSVDGPTEDLLRALRGAGRRVVAGTNTIAVHYDAHLRLGQYASFDKVYASHLMGAAKPEPAFWLRILAEEGVEARRAFFVDDYPENVEAAAALGLEARLYVDAATLARDLAGLGVSLPQAVRTASGEALPSGARG